MNNLQVYSMHQEAIMHLNKNIEEKINRKKKALNSWSDFTCTLVDVMLKAIEEIEPMANNIAQETESLILRIRLVIEILYIGRATFMQYVHASRLRCLMANIPGQNTLKPGDLENVEISNEILEVFKKLEMWMEEIFKKKEEQDKVIAEIRKKISDVKIQMKNVKLTDLNLNFISDDVDEHNGALDTLKLAWTKLGTRLAEMNSKTIAIKEIYTLHIFNLNNQFFSICEKMRCTDSVLV